MNISVVISTRNRAKRLPSLLDAFARIETPKGLRWDLVIVDNGSTDETFNILRQEKAKNRLPLVVLQQPVPGKSRSINYAMERLDSDLVIFADDDMMPEVDWLKTYDRAAKKRLDVSGFTGKILPVWESEIPNWLKTEGEYALPEGVINCRDYGDGEFVLSKKVIPGGGNTALRKDAFDRLGGFRIDLGPGTNIPLAEDTEFFTRFLNSGERFYYMSKALMYHYNVPERLTKRYVVNWVRLAGYCQIRGFKALSSVATVGGVPRYLIPQVITRLFFWLMEPNPAKRFHRKLRYIHTLGEIQGYLKAKRQEL